MIVYIVVCVFFQRLKASLHYTVGKIGEERGSELGVEVQRTVVAALTELAAGHLTTVAEDIEAFAK